MADEKQNNIVERLGNIPIVFSTFGQLSNMYSYSKHYVPNVLKPTVEKAEKNMVVLAESVAKTSVGSNLDSYACSKLDVLEDRYPKVKMPTNEIYDSVKTYVVDKVDPIIMYADSTVTPVINYADKYVDYLVPPSDNELEGEKVESTENHSAEHFKSKDKIVALSSKLRKRTYNRAINRINRVRFRSQETIDNLKNSINLIEYAKIADGKVRYVCHEILKSEEEVEQDIVDNNVTETSETLEKRVIATARHLSWQLKRTISSFPNFNTLPSSISVRIAETRKFTDDIYWSLSHVRNHSYRSSLAALNQSYIILQAFKIEDVPSIVIQNARTGIISFQENFSHIFDYFLNYLGNQSKMDERKPDESATKNDLRISDDLN